jgi:hypothetical protein
LNIRIWMTPLYVEQLSLMQAKQDFSLNEA